MKPSPVGPSRSHRSLFIATFVAVTALTVVNEGAESEDMEMRASSVKVMDQMTRNRKISVPAEVTKQGSEVLIQLKDKAIVLANPESVSQQIRQLPMQVELAPNAQRMPELIGMQLQAIKQWESKAAALKSRYKSVTDAHSELDSASKRALAIGATQADVRAFADSVEATKREVLQAYRSIPAGDRQEQRLLVEQHRELQTVSKALYGFGRDDRYPPATYEKIYENSRSTFALAEIGARDSRCSGVLVGYDLALTNNHCLLENNSEELEARFDYELNLDGSSRQQHTFPVTSFLVETEQARGGLDFVLLKLGTDASGRRPGDSYAPACLSLSVAARDDAVYVIGHPLGGPRTVHDNAFVYFPFHVKPEEFAELEIAVRSEFDSYADEDASYREGKLKEFKDSYRKVTSNGVDSYEYYSVRFSSQPTIGADCDTYRGNSGSPAYNRRINSVIGVLFDGQEDLGQPWRPGWRAHEAILPISKIVSQIESVMPEWDAAGSGVCIVQ